MPQHLRAPARAARPLVVVLLALFAMLAAAGQASAHAVLLSTTPGGWQLLADSPKEVSLRFTEPVDLGLTQVRLVDPRGKEVAGLGGPEHPEGRRDTVLVRVPATLANGTYTVAWRVVSADTHPVRGAFTFSVREATAPASAEALPEGDTLVSVLYGTSRWVATAGLALLVGTAFLVAVCWPGAVARRGVRRLLVAGAAATLGATLVSLLLYGPYAGGRPLAAVAGTGVLASALGSRVGLSLAARVLLLGVATALLVRHLGRDHVDADLPARTRARRGALVLAGSAVLAVTWSLVTHGAAGGLAPLSVPVDVLHLTATGVWLGGLPALAVLLRSGDVTTMRAAIPRFSTAAGVCVAVVAVTGLYQGWQQVGTPAALFGTTYGAWLLAKLGLVAVLLAGGALARRWVRKHYGAAEPVTVTGKRQAKRGPEAGEVGGFRKLVLAELVVAALLLGVTASLLGTEPARAELDRERNPAAVGGAEGPLSLAVPFDAGGLRGRGQVAFVLTPAAVGRNELHLVVLDPEGRPKQVPEVRAELSLPEAGIGPIAVPLTDGGPAHHVGTGVELPTPGRWELAIVVRTTEIDQTTVRVPVNAR